MTALSTAAWVAHDLGIATGVGGSLFGRVALHPAVKSVSSKEERGKVVKEAWQSFNNVQLAALGVMAATWFVGRSALTGREVDATSRKLVLAKDALVIGTLATAVGAAIGGRAMAAQAPGGAVPMESGDVPAAEAPQKAKWLKGLVDAFGITNLICGAGVVGVTAALAMRAGKSAKWSAISRLLK